MEGERELIRTASGAALYAENSGVLVERYPDSPIPRLGTPEFRDFVQTTEWMEMRHDEALEYDKAWAYNRRAEKQARVRQAFTDDFRARFPIDHHLRMDYEEAIRNRPADWRAQRIESLDNLSKAAILLTRIERPKRLVSNSCG